MLGKLSVALLLAASPALADDASAPEYKVKKVCHTVEVTGTAAESSGQEQREQ